jgi:hypothetical protein
MQCCAEVKEDPRMWLSRMEEGDQTEQAAPRGEVAPWPNEVAAYPCRNWQNFW